MALEKLGVQAVIKGLNQFLGGMKKMDKSIEEVGDESKKTAKKSVDFDKALRGIAAVAGTVTAALFAAKKAFDFAEEGAQLLRIEQAGENLASSFGTSMDKIVEAVDRAAKGTVARSDIILASNKAMTLGVASSAEQMAQLMEIAAVRAKAMGLTTTQAFSDIVTGIGRMSPMILDNLGILTGGEATFKAYAESIGKAADELTDAEKKQALFEKVLKETQPQLDAAADQADDLATSYEQLKVHITNAADEAKTSWAGIFTPVLIEINKELNKAEQLTADLDTMNLRITRDYGDLVKVVDKYGQVSAVTTDQLHELAEAERDKLDQDLELLKIAQDKINAGEEEGITLDQLIEKNKELVEEQEKLAQVEIDQSIKRLKDLIGEDLTGDFEEFTTKVGELTSEIETLEAIGDPTEAQRQGLIDTNKELDKTIKKWREHTKQIVFNIAEQALAQDGFTKDEAKALAKTAETLGLVDAGFEALTEKIWEDAEALESGAVSSDDFAESMGLTVDELNDATIAADNLAIAIENIPTAKEIAITYIMEDLGIDSLRGTRDIPTAGVVAGGDTVTNSDIANYHLSIQTSAPTEDIISDFRIMEAMGSTR